MYISFVEECIQNPNYSDYIGGRVEVFADGPYAEEEIRFLTKEVQKFNEFRDMWDMKNITRKELENIREIIKTYFMT